MFCVLIIVLVLVVLPSAVFGMVGIAVDIFVVCCVVFY